MIITSKNNPLIKETAGLKDKKGRREHSSFLVEGVKMARECQKSGLEIERASIVLPCKAVAPKLELRKK